MIERRPPTNGWPTGTPPTTTWANITGD
jgi:hypothetical protein